MNRIGLVDEWILKRTDSEQLVYVTLRDVLGEMGTDIVETYSWNAPFYLYKRKYICYFGLPKRRIGISFTLGKYLTDTYSRLKHNNLKQVRHFYIDNLEDDIFHFKAYIQQSMQLIDSSKSSKNSFLL